jgi:hypothetical protein
MKNLLTLFLLLVVSVSANANNTDTKTVNTDLVVENLLKGIESENLGSKQVLQSSWGIMIRLSR